MKALFLRYLDGTRLLRFAQRYFGKRVGEFFGNVLEKVVGVEGAFRTRLSFYKLRATAFDRFGLAASLWVGRKTAEELYKKVRWVSPADIKYVIKQGEVPYIQSGSWDLSRRSFELHPTVIDILVEKKHYKETRQYAEMASRIAKGQPAYWCKSTADIDRYFEVLQSACAEIQDGNYRVQPEGPNQTGGLYPNEILVSIDRDGNLLHERGGSHRLSAAKISGLSSVPVVVLRRHYLYARKTGDWGNNFS